MIAGIETTVRPATLKDRQGLASLIHFEQHVHRHLDWRPALDWLGHQPYLVLERNNQLVAALSCPPDPPGIAWIRMFACADNLAASYAWRLLWPAARELLAGIQSAYAAAIPMQPWFKKILAEGEFVHTHNVVLMAWEGPGLPATPPQPPARIRPMTPGDLPAVQVVDAAAFNEVWRNSLSSLELAFRQSAVASVAEDQQGVLGYQISTRSAFGGHLARLAVHPRAQRRGVALALLWDLLSQFESQGVSRVTVNTQHDNHASLSLYEKASFRLTGEEYPVYQVPIH